MQITREPAIFGDDQLEGGMVLPQLGDQALGGIALTVVFGCAIVFHDGLGHQRNHLAFVGMQEDCAQHLMGIGDGAIAVMRF